MRFQGNLPPGITRHNVIVYCDGLGLCDRRTKTLYTWTNAVSNISRNNGKTTTYNATTSKVNCGNQLIGTGDVTISAWVNPVGWGESNVGTIADNGKFILRLSSAGTVRLSYDGTTFAVSAASSISTGATAWYHIAATMVSAGGSTGNIYIDSALSGTANQAVGTAANGSTNLIIGNNNGAGATWDGDIGPVIIFNKVLTAEQIGWIYNKFK